MTLFALLVTFPLWCDCLSIHFPERVLVLSSILLSLSILSSVCSSFPVSLYLSWVLRDRVLFFASWLSLYTGRGDLYRGSGVGAGLACFGTFLVREGDVFEFIVFVVGNASLSPYTGRRDFRGAVGGCVASWVVRVSLTVPCNPSRVAVRGSLVALCSVVISLYGFSIFLSSLRFYPSGDRGAGLLLGGYSGGQFLFSRCEAGNMFYLSIRGMGNTSPLKPRYA
jgi:hypothetical protein